MNQSVLDLLQQDDDEVTEMKEEPKAPGVEVKSGAEVYTELQSRDLVDSQLCREVADHMDGDYDSTSSGTDQREQLPSVVIKNVCGEDITVALYVNSNRPSVFTTCLATARKVGQVIAPFLRVSRLYTPWTLLCDSYDGPVFPIVTFSMLMKDGSSYSASPAPLHSLASRLLFLTRHVSCRFDSYCKWKYTDVTMWLTDGKQKRLVLAI